MFCGDCPQYLSMFMGMKCVGWVVVKEEARFARGCAALVRCEFTMDLYRGIELERVRLPAVINLFSIPVRALTTHSRMENEPHLLSRKIY